MKADFGKYIRELRKKEGLTLTQLGAKLGIDSGALSKIETGKRELNENTLPLLAEAFNLDLEKLKEELLSEKIANTIYDNNCNENVLALAEQKIKYLKSRKVKIRKK